MVRKTERLHRNILIYFLFGAIFFLLIIVRVNYDILPGVKSQGGPPVEIDAEIYSCELQLTVYPEKRIPVINNWGTILDVEIYDALTNNYYGKFITTSNNQGTASVDLCDSGMYLQHRTYDIYIKGYSHLRREFSNIVGFTTYTTSLDFSSLNNLLAGETSNVYDNYINALDISTQISSLETLNLKNDLNRDGEVNVLDLSNTITNYNMSGDCSPQEVLNGVCN